MCIHFQPAQRGPRPLSSSLDSRTAAGAYVPTLLARMYAPSRDRIADMRKTALPRCSLNDVGIQFRRNQDEEHQAKEQHGKVFPQAEYGLSSLDHQDAQRINLIAQRIGF